jgi:hypothetical protein
MEWLSGNLHSERSLKKTTSYLIGGLKKHEKMFPIFNFISPNSLLCKWFLLRYFRVFKIKKTQDQFSFIYLKFVSWL